ncbi:MAG: low temperature requirement protein A [Nitrospirota bacterium]
MRTLPRQELQTLRRPLRSDAVAGGIDPGSSAAVQNGSTGVIAAGYSFVSRLCIIPKTCSPREIHIRRPGWTELFFDLVFAAAIAQLSAPLDHDYSVYGIGRFAFWLALVFLAWFGYTSFSTQFGVDDVVERVLIVAQVFLVAVMAANATDALNSRDAAGFGAAYGGVRAILAVQYARVLRSPNAERFVKRRIGGLLLSAVLWTVSALFPVPERYIGWTLALLVDIDNSWPASRTTAVSPPGATHFPERFGLLTIILLGEFVASVMRGIESQMGWSFLAASAAVLSLGLGFAIWSCYSDGAMGWEARHVRSYRDVVRLRGWIALHFGLFLGIGVLGVGLRRAIALPAGGHFSATEQWNICSATAGIILVLIGIALTSEHHSRSRRTWVWVAQLVLVICVLALSPFYSRIIATALLAILLLCILIQTALLITNRRFVE